MSHWALTDYQILTAAILGLTSLLLITLPFEKSEVTRKEVVRLQEDVNRLAGDVRTLKVSVLKVCIAKREAASGHSEMAMDRPLDQSVKTGNVREPAVNRS
jgi:hypothetical protein